MARKNAGKAQEARKIVRITFDTENVDVSKLKAALNAALTAVKDDIQKMNEALSGIAPGGLKAFTDGLAAAAGLMESSVRQTRELRDLLNSLDLSKAGLPSVPAGGAVAASAVAVAPMQHIDLSAGSEQLSHMVTLLEQVAVSSGKADAQMQAFAGATNKTADAADKAHAGLRKELDEMEKLRNQAEQTRSAFMMIGGAFAATTASVIAFGRKAVTTAGQFEKLRAKLVTAQHSASKAAETFEFAKQLAATTPFDVQGVVGAAVQLEVYGQKSQEILPKVADLAAGMGMSVEEAARVVGKALSGSREGLESLRNTYGVSTQKLIEHGAAMNKQGSIALETTEDLGKMKKALLEIIDTDFAGAIERQSQTYEGAISNLEDEVANVSAAIGDKMIPVITIVTRHLSDLVGLFSDVPPWAVWATAGAAGLASLSGGIITTVAGMASMSAQAFTAASALEKAGGAGKALVPLLQAIGEKSASAGSLLANNMGKIAIGGGIAAAATAAYIAIEAWEQAEIRAQRLLEEETRKTAQAAQGWRNLRNAIKEATGVELSYAGGDIVAEWQKILAEKGELNVIEALRPKFPAEDVEKELKKSQQEVENIKAEIKETEESLRKLTGGETPEQALITLRKRGEMSQNAWAGLLDDDSSPIQASHYEEQIQQIDKTVKKLNELNSKLKPASNNVEALELIAKGYNEISTATADAIKQAQDLDVYLKFADKAKDAALLEDAVKKTAESLGQLKKAVLEDFKTGNIQITEADLKDSKSVTARLAKADPNSKEFELLSLIAQKQEELEKRSEALTKQRQSDLREKIRIMDAEFEYAQAGREKDLAKEREHLQKKLEEYQKYQISDANIKALQAERDAPGTLPERKAFIDARLKEVEAIRAAEAKLRNELLANEKAIQKEREETAKKREQEAKKATQKLKEQIDDLLKDAKELGTAGISTIPQITNAFDAVIRRAKTWGEENKNLLTQSEELRKSYDKTLKSIEEAKSEAIAKQTVKDLSTKTSDMLNGATTPVEQLSSVRELIGLYEKTLKTNQDIKKNLQEQAQAQNALNELKKKEVSLTKQIQELSKKQDEENKDLELQFEQEKLQTLEQRKQNGEDVASQYEAQEKKIYEMKLASLERQKQAELDAVKGTGEEAAALRLKIEKEYETRKLILQEQSDRTRLSKLKASTAKELKSTGMLSKQKQQDSISSLSSLILGKNFGKAGSPLMTMQEALAEHGKLYEAHWNSSLGSGKIEAPKTAEQEAEQATRSFARSANEAAPSLKSLGQAAASLPESLTPARSGIDTLALSATAAAQALAQLPGIIQNMLSMPTPQQAGAVMMPDMPARAITSQVNNSSSSQISNVYFDRINVTQDLNATAIAKAVTDYAKREQQRKTMREGRWR